MLVDEHANHSGPIETGSELLGETLVNEFLAGPIEVKHLFQTIVDQGMLAITVFYEEVEK
ncbi:MAG: hypothetical protein AAB407_02710 [Patescibacteria group bacterium]